MPAKQMNTLVSATLQCYLYHNKYFGLGIGGIITGLFLNYKIHFCRSLEFYMFENDISSGNSVSVINRYNSFFSSSQIGHQRGYINQVLDKEIFNDEYVLSSISKSVNTKLPLHELIPEDVFENYCIIVVEDDDEKKLIGGYDLNLFLQKYSNVFEVKGMFEEVLFELLKHYYIDDRFFHIDKFVIAADNAKTANLLRNILPEYNYEERHPDVFLIRSMVESQMPGGLRYAVSDIFVAALMKLSMDDMGLLESIAYGDFEIPEDISKLPFNC